MSKTPVTPSIAAVEGSMGEKAAKHFELFWRDLFVSEGAFQNEHCFRLITNEQHPLGNFVFLSESSSTLGLEQAVSPLLDVAAPTAVFMAGEASEPVARCLNDLGYSQEKPMPAMAVDIAALATTELPSGYEFSRVYPGENATEWTDVLTTGYPLPHRVAEMFSPNDLGDSSAVDASTQFFAVQREGKIVATSMTYLAGGLAGVYCVATLKEERGKGLGAHVTAGALRAAEEQGYRVGVLQSSAAGHSIYQALGFSDRGEVHAFVRMPGSIG